MVSDIFFTPSTYTITTPLSPENVTQKWCHVFSSISGFDKILQLKIKNKKKND